MKKRIVSLLLTALMLLSLVPVSVLAETEQTYAIFNGTPEEYAEANHGYITVDKTEAKAGEPVNVTVTSEDGYKLKELYYQKVTDTLEMTETRRFSETRILLNDTVVSTAKDKTYFESDCLFDDASEMKVNTPVPDESLTLVEDIYSGTEIENQQEIHSIEISDNARSFSFDMPAYPIVLVATFYEDIWTEWEPFETGTGTWTFSVLLSKPASMNLNVYVRTDKTLETHKQIGVEGWGRALFGTDFDLFLNWNTVTNNISVETAYTGVSFGGIYELLVYDQVTALGERLGAPSFYDPETDTFTIALLFGEGPSIMALGTETLKMLPKGALKYDASDKDFTAEFGNDDTELEYVDGAVLIHALNADNEITELFLGLEEDACEIPAGEYEFDKTMNPGTALASSGVLNGSLTYSFGGNINDMNQVMTPLWFIVSGKVTVSYVGNEMTMVIAGKNSYGRDIDVTINKTVPDKYSVTDMTLDSNGSVEINRPSVPEGFTVTLNVIPNDGYKLKEGTLKAIYNDGNGEKEVELTQDTAEKNKFYFVMPAGDVTVTAEFEETDETFKAVWNSDTGVLTFFYDKLNHAGKHIAIYDELTNDAGKAADWLFDGIRDRVKSVVVDESVKDYTGLKSTAYMFYYFVYAEDITGAEYLSVDNVTNMSNMFAYYGFAGEEFDKVPDVSEWNTENVTDMSNMFACYGYSSMNMNSVPAVGEWETGKASNINSMFIGYANSSTVLDEVPAVEEWNIENVADMGGLFFYYGYTSEILNFSLDLSGWDLSGAKNIEGMFTEAGTNAALWEVCIPAVTGELKNSPNKWYGKDETVYTVPLTDKEFTLSYSDITFLTKASATEKVKSVELNNDDKKITVYAKNFADYVKFAVGKEANIVPVASVDAKYTKQATFNYITVEYGVENAVIIYRDKTTGAEATYDIEVIWSDGGVEGNKNVLETEVDGYNVTLTVDENAEYAGFRFVFDVTGNTYGELDPEMETSVKNGITWFRIFNDGSNSVTKEIKYTEKNGAERTVTVTANFVDPESMHR